MELLTDGKWREEGALPALPGGPPSGGLLVREFSRESSSHKNGNSKMKTHTEDGARIVANGRVYRQIFEDEVRLVAELENRKLERLNKPPVQQIRSSRDTSMPAVRNCTQHGFLDLNGRHWVEAEPNVIGVSNPVHQRQQQTEAKLEGQKPERWHCSREVHDLPDIVLPAKLNSDIIDRITEKRREKHNETMEEMHQALAQITLQLEPRIAKICDCLNARLENNDQIIAEHVQRIDTDEGLLMRSKEELHDVWSNIADQASVRRAWIEEADVELSAVEEERIRRIRSTMSDFANLLEKVSHIAPADLHRIIDEEAMDINNTLLTNRRGYADLYARLMMADIDRERRQHAWWMTRLEDWKRLMTDKAVNHFRTYMQEDDCVNPPSIQAILVDLHSDHRRLCDIRSELLDAVRRDLVPPKATKTYVQHWNKRVIAVCREIDQTNQNFLKALFEEFERVSQACLGEMSRMKQGLVEAGVCTSEEVEAVVKERCIPLIGQRQRDFEARLEEIDRGFERLNARVSAQLKSLFKFSQGIAHIWDRHELGLAGQERRLHEHLESSRHNHDIQNQEKEAALDMIMDRMRQESTESGLKDCLKKAFDMLEKIKVAYNRFHDTQAHIVKGYPGMIDDEIDSYDRALCRFFGLSKEGQKPKETKSPTPKKKVSKKKSLKPKPEVNEKKVVKEEAKETNAEEKHEPKEEEIRPDESKEEEIDIKMKEDSSGESKETNEEEERKTVESEHEMPPEKVEEKKEQEQEQEEPAVVPKVETVEESELVSRAFKEILTTANGTQFYVLTVAGKHGVPPPEGGNDVGEGGADGPPQRPPSAGFIEAASSEAPPAGAVTPYVELVTLSEALMVEIKQQIRQNFLEHLDEWRLESLARSHKIVAAKLEELESELRLRLHLHQPRPRRTEFDVHNVRAAELVLHSERVTRHCKGITQVLTELRTSFTEMNESHNRLVEQFRADIEAMEEIFVNATKSTKIVSLVSQLGTEVERFMTVIRVSLREFRQHLDEKLAMLREANARFIRSFKLFSEGGNFCPEEVDEYRKRLEKMSHKVDSSESTILSDLEGMEKKRLEQAHKISQEFEDRFKHHLADLLFMEKVARWLTNTQVKIKAEVADSNSQAQKLAQTLIRLDKRIDACDKPNLDKEQVSPDQLKEGLNEVFRAFHDRSIYLNCVKTQQRPPTPGQVAQGAPGSAMRVVFSEPTPISRAGKQPAEDASVSVIKSILKAQRQRNAPPEPETADVGGEEAGRARRKGGHSKEGARTALGAGSNEGLTGSQAAEPHGRTSRLPSLQGSQLGDVAPSKRTSRRGSTSTLLAGEGGGGGGGGGRRAMSASRRYVAKNQRLDKKYLVFGEPEGDETEERHFLGRVKGICREALDGMLLAAELYYRQKGGRPVTRPQSLQETFDQCAEVIMAKLQSYYQQADEYHNNCLQELRNQLEKLEHAIELVPGIVINRMTRMVLDECRDDMQRVTEDFSKRAAALEAQRSANEARLRPNLGHPNEAPALEALTADELARHEAVLAQNEAHKQQLRMCVGECGQRFADRLSSLTEQMLLQFDNLLTVDDVEKGRQDPAKHKTTELIRRKQSGAPLEDDDDETLIPRGKQTWPGLMLTEFVIEELLGPGRRARTMAAAVVSAKTTMGHNSSVRARDLAYQTFRERFHELLANIDVEVRKLEMSEERWNENWKCSVQRVKDLY